MSSSGAADSDRPEPLEPDVQERSAEAAQSMTGVRIPDGWQIELFAAEPDVANIVAFDIDHQGQMYVAESYRQSRGVTDNRAHDEEWLLADLAAKTVQDRIDYHRRLLGDAAITYAQHDDRIRRVRDTDGDGKVDESIVVANGFNRLEEGTGAGILARGGDLYYSCIPKLWKLVDQDNDGVVDERIAMSDGYGVRVAFRGHDLHGLILGPDGRLYFSIGDRGYHVTTDAGELLANPAVGAVFRCELDGSDLEVVCNGLRNPQELAFNDWGDFFTVDNNSDSGDQARIVQILEGGDSGWRMYYQYLADRGPFNREKIWHPFHPEQPAYINPPIANFTDGPSGLVYYPGTGFGDQLRDTFLICDFRGGPSNSGVRSFRLEPDGAFFSLADDGQPIWTLLATDIAFGPGGGMYVSDWVDGWEGLGKGRIYRLTDPRHQGTPIVNEVQQLLSSDWQAREDDSLAELLSHVDRRVRLEAQWEIARRGNLDRALEVVLNKDAETRTRLHAIWAADQIVRRNNDQLKLAASAIRDLLGSEDAMLRAAAAKFAGERGDSAATNRLLELVSDDSARVRYHATMSLAKHKTPGAFNAVVKLLADNDNRDPAIRHAGVMYLASQTDQRVAELTDHTNSSVRRAAVVALRRNSSAKLSEFLDDGDRLVVAEAARSIHDTPVPAALRDLAGLIDRVQDESDLTLRVLNANFRLGTTEAAAALAKFAAQESAAESARLEAIDMLVDWKATDPRDRVLNDHRPLNERSPEMAAGALRGVLDQLMTSTSAVREATIDAASKLGLKEIVPALVKRVEQSDRAAASRAASLTALERLNADLAVNSANAVPLKPANELTSASLRVLAKHRPKPSIDRFIEATGSGNREVRQLAWDILGEIREPRVGQAIKTAVERYIAGDLPKDVELNVLEAADGRMDDSLSQRLTEHREAMQQADPVAPWLASLAGGDPVKGGELFFGKTELSCVRCHKVHRTGGEVGPELTVIGKQRDAKYLLEAIVLPDAAIAKGFETAMVIDLDGQVHTGIVKAETDQVLELIAADGSQIQIAQDDIDLRREGKSSMPADLTKSMTARELRDLVAYLVSLKVDPRAEDDVE